VGISVGKLLIILVIILLLFGSKRLRTLGMDLAAAIKGFRGALREGEEPPKTENPDQPAQIPDGTKKETGKN